jgi:hypothetical protein
MKLVDWNPIAGRFLCYGTRSSQVFLGRYRSPCWITRARNSKLAIRPVSESLLVLYG